jgi:hypothetical protein
MRRPDASRCMSMLLQLVSRLTPGSHCPSRRQARGRGAAAAQHQAAAAERPAAAQPLHRVRVSGRRVHLPLRAQRYFTYDYLLGEDCWRWHAKGLACNLQWSAPQCLLH